MQEDAAYMTHPKRVSAFKEWARMMTEQALVPERLEYKSNKGGNTLRTTGSNRFFQKKRLKRRIRRKRQKQE